MDFHFHFVCNSINHQFSETENFFFEKFNSNQTKPNNPCIEFGTNKSTTTTTIQHYRYLMRLENFSFSFRENIENELKPGNNNLDTNDLI